jgi:hypothetical protein
MRFGTTFTYQCGKCDFKYQYVEYEPTLFMVEGHVVKTGHIYGTFTKSELDEKWNDKLVYKKYSVWLGMKRRFKMSKTAHSLLKALKTELKEA